jgi:uncharacterized protein (DUF1697 family)
VKRYVALLRGINVGRGKRVAMADLRALLAALGYAEVRTLRNSGNAVFDAVAGSAESHAQEITAALAGRLGVVTPVVVKAATGFKAALAANPLLKVATNHSRLLLLFTQHRAALRELQGLAAIDWSPERFAVGEQAAYLWLPAGSIGSAVAKAVETTLGARGTSRNWATVQKLAALL